jgi:hypothetical protein
MKRITFICGLAAYAVAGELAAKEFPLTLKSVTAEQAAALPGGAGAFAQLQAKKPPELKREPAGASGQSLYGVIGRGPGSSGMIFRLDATGGEGSGHDQLLLDLNQNGDLTDDAAIKLAGTPQTTRSASTSYEFAWYGPIAAPATNRLAQGTPVYYAQLSYYRTASATDFTGNSQPYLGTLRLRPGFWLETTVEWGGLRQKIGVLDGNANFRLGDEAKPVISKVAKDPTWYFPPADSFLVDRNGSGKFEADRLDSESQPFGPMLTLGSASFRVKLTANCAALDLEPWPGTPASLALQPNGAQVRDVTLAWERTPKDWVLLKPSVTQGRASVPPGVLCFNGCVLEVQTRDGSPLVLVGSYRKMDKALRATAGQTATLVCGGPLEIQLAATKRKGGTVAGMSGSGRPVTESFVDLQAEIIGRAGETYGTFLTGKNLTSSPPAPKFTITTRDGRQVASGNLEYG